MEHISGPIKRNLAELKIRTCKNYNNADWYDKELWIGDCIYRNSCDGKSKWESYRKE